MIADIQITSAAIGALTALVVGLILLAVRESKADIRIAKQRRQDQAAAAFDVFVSLYRATNNLLNTEREIDDAFARTANDKHVEISQKVKPLIGGQRHVDGFSSNALAFLIEEKEFNLFRDVLLVTGHFEDIESQLEQYKEMWLAAQSYLEEKATDASFVEGTDAGGSFGMSNLHYAIADLKVRQLNNFAGQLIEKIDADAGFAKTVTSSFVQIAKRHFGSDFQTFKVEWVR